MKVVDQQTRPMERMNHQLMLKSIKEADKKHDQRRIRNIELEIETREKRNLALIKHEEINHANMQIRIEEVEKHQSFLKLSLKII